MIEKRRVSLMSIRIVKYGDLNWVYIY